jgi:hypothetical protein
MQFMDLFDCRKTSSNATAICPCAPTSRPHGFGLDTSDGKNGEFASGILEVICVTLLGQIREFAELESTLLKTPTEPYLSSHWRQEELLKLQVKYRFETLNVLIELK